MLVRVSREYDAPPLYVTENGAAFPDVVTADGEVDDADRVAYLDGHLRAAKRAIDRGVDLRGYFAWSLLDNFEWAWGYDRRFGIVHVDYDTQVRTVKASGRWYADVARATRCRPGPRSSGRARRSRATSARARGASGQPRRWITRPEARSVSSCSVTWSMRNEHLARPR